jgi:hypothetical protein
LTVRWLAALLRQMALMGPGTWEGNAWTPSVTTIWLWHLRRSGPNYRHYFADVVGVGVFVVVGARIDDGISNEEKMTRKWLTDEFGTWLPSISAPLCADVPKSILSGDVGEDGNFSCVSLKQNGYAAGAKGSGTKSSSGNVRRCRRIFNAARI